MHLIFRQPPLTLTLQAINERADKDQDEEFYTITFVKGVTSHHTEYSLCHGNNLQQSAGLSCM